jgi:RNA polymerase sigma-70 factor (ECF subfamily)
MEQKGQSSDVRAAEEVALMSRVAAGDRGEPLETLYERYAGRLYGLGMRLLRDEGAAEELVQETFVRLWRSSSNYDARKGSVRSFLYTIAHRAAVDFERRPASRPLDTRDELTAESAPATESFEALLLGLDVRDAMTTLSDNHRQVLELHYREDLTQRQIAERLGAPLGTVKTRTYHALRALKSELQERELVA